MKIGACAFVVLILVLMEDTLGELLFHILLLSVLRLNPCSNGRYSRRINIKHKKQRYGSLNPCSNGRYSRRVRGVKALFQAGGE